MRPGSTAGYLVTLTLSACSIDPTSFDAAAYAIAVSNHFSAPRGWVKSTEEVTTTGGVDVLTTMQLTPTMVVTTLVPLIESSHAVL